MEINRNFFYSKVLLTGEYTVTLGSKALAIPFRKFKGRFEWSDIENETLKPIYRYIKDSPWKDFYDIQKLDQDIKNGIRYEADVPLGYGLGSSGVLVAAVYDRYATQKTSDLNLLKDILAATENAFHGASSGIDPLVSWVNQAILMDRGSITVIDEQSLPLSSFFLLDTKISRSTSAFVNIFKTKLDQEPSFQTKVNELSHLNGDIATSLIVGDAAKNRDIMKKISQLQYEYFNEMIPESFKEIWKTGLWNDAYYLKLCGAGGGGMLLVWSDDLSNIEHLNPIKLTI